MHITCDNDLCIFLNQLIIYGKKDFLAARMLLQVLNIINAMNNIDLKDWLSEIVKKDMGLGVKIIKNKRK